MKKIFAMVMMVAALSMAGCCGNANKKAAAEETCACCEQCEEQNECCAEEETCACCEEAEVEAPAEVPAE